MTDEIRQFVLDSIVDMNYAIDDIDDDTTLGPAGADLQSIVLAELVVRVEDQFHVSLDDQTEVLPGMTVGEFCHTVVQRIQPAPGALTVPDAAQRPGAMNIRDIDHVEFYVGDAMAAAQSLCTAYGFRSYGRGGPDTGLPGQRSVLLGQGDIRVLLTTGLNQDHPASRFVAKHGDGVAVIAFRADSAATAYTEAVTAGGPGISPPRTWENEETRVVTAEVAGFGDVLYRLVERHGLDALFQPGAIEMEPGAAVGADDDVLRIIDHVAVCVPAGELDSTVAFHEQVFGFAVTFEEYIEIGEQGMMSKVVQSPSGGVTFTILQPDLSRPGGQIDDFLAWHDGAGVQHLAFLTKDIVQAVQTFVDRGVAFGVTPPSYYDMLAARLGATDIEVEALRPLGILVDRDHWGQMYQIFAQSTHIRRTYFHELIDRHGARTFGTSNIPALYAAKARELAGIHDTAGTMRA